MEARIAAEGTVGLGTRSSGALSFLPSFLSFPRAFPLMATHTFFSLPLATSSLVLLRLTLGAHLNKISTFRLIPPTDTYITYWSCTYQLTSSQWTNQ